MLAAACAAAAATTLITAPQTASASASGTRATAAVCRLAVEGYVEDRWLSLGGQGGPLGCPINQQYLMEGGGVRQHFQGGQIAWSPRQGDKMTVVATQWDGYLRFRWGSTAPFHYDYFVVSWYIPGTSYRGTSKMAGGTSGAFKMRRSTNRRYVFSVVGCDTRFLASDVCRQGYTTQVSTTGDG
ncbi:hypothetical protein Skr01_47900 [Sphaerisporangium krabiense]|nr:hypothetical protein Skr01_47900 [Sphaerisporangium krabiense]